jgi:hypothetical protein
MVAKCANYWCSASRHAEEVLLADIQLGDRLSDCQTNAVHLWLCTRCFREMTPELDPSHAAETRLLQLVSRAACLPAVLNVSGQP